MTQTTSLHHLHAATAELDPPLAALDLTALDRNAADLVRRANGTAIRVASKSVRCRAVLERVLGGELTARGGFAGIMAYSLREAIWLARLGARDVLLGYPVLDRAGLAELAAAPNLLAAITLMIDDVAQLELTRAALGTDLVHPASVSMSTPPCGSARCTWAPGAHRCAVPSRQASWPPKRCGAGSMWSA